MAGERPGLASWKQAISANFGKWEPRVSLEGARESGNGRRGLGCGHHGGDGDRTDGADGE